MIKRRNNDNLVKIDELKVEVNWERGRLQKKWIEVIWEDMTACSINKNMVNDSEGKNISSCVEWRHK